MKYRVVGWVSYDDPDVGAKYASPAAIATIIDDIKRHGYCFSGHDHGAYPNCAPVLNDGKKRLFSERGFGALMAEAHGDLSRMGYSSFAFGHFGEEDGALMPDDDFSPYEFVPEENLNEEISVEATAEDRAAADRGELTLPDAEALRFLDAGDTLTLLLPEGRASYLVTAVKRRRDLDEDFILHLMHNCDPPEKQRRNEEIFEAAPFILIVRLTPKE